MKKLGYVMITVGFLAGALVAVLDETNVQWAYFTGTIVLGALGILIVRLSLHRDSRSEQKISVNLQDIEVSLSRIVENIDSLNAQKQSINPYDIRHRIDELFTEDLTTFVQARETLAQVHGLQAYADVMSHFASAERYLNRVWSASADGYINEVATYLDKAKVRFSEALRKVRCLKK